MISEMMTNFIQEINNIGKIIFYIGTPFSALLGIWKYSHTVKKEQRDREAKTYDALDETYKEFLTLCFNNPHLDIYDVADMCPSTLTDEQKKQEMIALTMLISIFERAYLMYRRQSSAFRRKQWKGWEEYMADYCRRANFKQAWEKNGDTYDTSFIKYMEKLFKKARSL